MTPVASHSWTRGSLINCLPWIVAVFWSRETSKTTDSWKNLACSDSSMWKNKKAYGDLPFSAPPDYMIQTPSVYFWGVGEPEQTLCHLSTSTPHPCCVLLCTRLPCVISRAAACGLNSSWAPFTGLTVELAASRVWLKFEIDCVCLQCLQMSSVRKVNITWAV